MKYSVILYHGRKKTYVEFPFNDGVVKGSGSDANA